MTGWASRLLQDSRLSPRHTVRTVYPSPIMLRLIALAALVVPAVFAQEQFIDWLSDYQQALTQAKATKKPIFLEFRCEA